MNPAVRRTKYLTEAAAAAAIAALLVLLKLLAPFLVFVTMIAAAVPIAIICDFHGMKWGLGTCVAEVLIVNMFGGPEIGLTTAFYAAALGLAMGYGFRHKLSYAKTLNLTALAYIVEMSYKIVFSIYILGIADALSSMIDRLVTFVRWAWQPLSRLRPGSRQDSLHDVGHHHGGFDFRPECILLCVPESGNRERHPETHQGRKKRIVKIKKERSREEASLFHSRLSVSWLSCPGIVVSSVAVVIVWVAIWIRAVMRLDVVAVLIAVAIDVDISGCGLGACKEGREKDCCCDEFLHILLLCRII